MPAYPRPNKKAIKILNKVLNTDANKETKNKKIK